jgi:flagellar hook-length control protein FliK
MRSLPIPPATPSAAMPDLSSSNAANNNAAPASEVFGNILQRQRANQPEASMSGRNGVSGTPIQNNQAPNPPAVRVIGDAQAVLADSGILRGNLAALNNIGSQDVENEQAPAPDNTGTLPADMLAMLLPVPVTLQPAAKVGDQAASVAEAGPISEQMAAMLLRASGNVASTPATVRLDAAQALTTPGSIADGPQSVTGNLAPSAMAYNIVPPPTTFSAVMEGLNSEAARAAQLSSQSALAVVPENAVTINLAPQQSTAPLAGVPGSAPTVINTPVTDKAWGSEFNQKVTWLATGREHSAELHLNPPNLGPLDVVLKVSGDQATALFTSPHGVVREAIEQALPKLREMLAENGITLGNATVSDQSSRQQGLFDNANQGGRNSSGSIEPDAAGSEQLSGTAASSARRHQGMVDTFA